jgi:hypothetical protein
VIVQVDGMGLIAGPPARGTMGEAAVSATSVVRKVAVEANMLILMLGVVVGSVLSVVVAVDVCCV